MFQQFFLKAMLQKQLASLPKETRDVIESAVLNNPDFFKRLVDEMKKRIDGGMNQMDAAKAVFMENKDELARLMKP